MVSNQLGLDPQRDPYVATAVDTLRVVLQSGTAGDLSIAAPEILQGLTHQPGRTVLEPILSAPETPLAGLIEGYGSDASKLRLVNAVAWMLHDESALLVTDLHESSTLADAARAIAGRLQAAPPAYRCTAAPKHSFRDRGTGVCIFDGSPLVRA